MSSSLVDERVYGGELGGYIAARPGADPAAGAEVDFVVPGGKSWDLLMLTFRLVTSATVANRSPTITIDDGTDILGQFGTEIVHTASNDVRYTFAPQLGYAKAQFANLSMAIGIPPLRLRSGWHVRTATGALDAGDNYGVPRMLVYELPSLGIPSELSQQLVLEELRALRQALESQPAEQSGYAALVEATS